VLRLIVITLVLVVYRKTSGLRAERSGWGPSLRRRFPGRWYYRSIGRRHLHSMPQVRSFLLRHFYFAGWLSEHELDEFTYRVHVVMQSKIFVDPHDVAPEVEKCLLLSASITQLTFGLHREYWLPAYTHIRIHPDIFYSRLVDAYVKGLTLDRSIVHISWQHYLDGIADPTSGICLGLHEFAHAMVLDPSTLVQENHILEWKKLARRMVQQGSEASQLIREYGFRNENELWAVSCELFFEQPVDFLHHHPELYRATAKLLNQDTAARVLNRHKVQEVAH